MTIFLDLDGTLTDPQEGIVGCLEHALEVMGVDPSNQGNLSRFIGPPLVDVMGELVGTENPDRVSQAVGAYRARYNTQGYLQNRPYDGIHDVLGRLKEAFGKLLLVTSKPTPIARQIVAHFELAPYLDAIHGSGENGELADKRVLIHHVLQSESLSACDVVMVGDRKHDIVGANHNHVAGVGVLWGYGSETELTQAGARALCKAPEELPSCLQELKRRV